MTHVTDQLGSYTYHFISCFTRNTERAWLIMSSSLDANIARPYRDGWISWLEMQVVIDEISEKIVTGLYTRMIANHCKQNLIQNESHKFCRVVVANGIQNKGSYDTEYIFWSCVWKTINLMMMSTKTKNLQSIKYKTTLSCKTHIECIWWCVMIKWCWK